MDYHRRFNEFVHMMLPNDVQELYRRGEVFADSFSGPEKLSTDTVGVYLTELFGELSYSDGGDIIRCQPVGFFKLSLDIYEAQKSGKPVTLSHIDAQGVSKLESIQNLADSVQKGMTIVKPIPKTGDKHQVKLGIDYKLVSGRSNEHDHESLDIINCNIVSSDEHGLLGSVSDQLTAGMHIHLKPVSNS